MAVRLGELLLREKRITPTQLQEALNHQKANGGKLNGEGVESAAFGGSMKDRPDSSSQPAEAGNAVRARIAPARSPNDRTDPPAMAHMSVSRLHPDQGPRNPTGAPPIWVTPRGNGALES